MIKTKFSLGKRIGKHIKYQRNKSKWSLQDLSTKTSLIASFLTRLEAVNYKNISYGTIEKLSREFAIPPIEFLKKCDITEDRYISLPDFEFYLREKSQLQSEAL